MKSMLLIVVAVIVISAVFVFNSGIIQKTTGNNDIENSNPQKLQDIQVQDNDYKKIGSDKDDVVESNNALLLRVEGLQKQLDQLNNNTNTVVEKPAILNNNTTKTKGEAVVKNIISKVEKKVDILAYKISDDQNPNNQHTQQIIDNNQFVWQNSILSQIITDTNTVSINLTQNINDQNIIIPKYTIANNSVFDVINMTALLGRIPSSKGEVQDPYRFTLKIDNIGLFANYHSSNKLNGVIVSGTSSGDLLLSCVRASIDSITYIFRDGTISQNNGVDLATITDEYGYPCVKGGLVTNAPQYIATNAILSGLATAANAIANAEQTTTTDASGNSSSSITGNNEKFALYNSVAGVTTETQKWVSERAKQSFDVIVAPAGQKLQLFFNKEVSIDYNKNGRKLVHKNKKERVNDYDKFD